MDRIIAPLRLLAVVFMLTISFSSTALAAATPQALAIPGATLNVPGRLTEDLRQIGLALQAYQDVNGHFPPAYIADAKGRPLLSWRVLLLPYLGEQDLFSRFDTTKPWDSRANLALLQQIPEVYRGPQAPHKTIFTHYAGVAGTGTFFDCVQAQTNHTACAGTRLSAITDGTSNTLAVGEVAQAKIPWTMPDDVDILAHPTLGERGGFSGILGDNVPFVFVDGTVRFLPNSTTADLFHSFATINGGEVTVQVPTVAERLGEDLRQIGLALENYRNQYGHYPPAYIADTRGRPLLSWRVLLLPYLGEQDLFSRFDTTKPWNSPANMALLQQIPEVYRGPLAPRKTTFTHYAGVAGTGTFFDCVQARTNHTACSGTLFSAITDGTSNTLAVGEVAQARIPWTMPEDVDIRTQPTLGERGGFSNILGADVPFVFVDGAVQFLPDSTTADMIHALATINGGEPIH